MKKVVCLFLCLFILLFCIGCQKEDEPQLNKGTFYISDGETYNTHVRIILPEQNLTAPVSKLTLEVQNDTDYFVLVLNEEFPLEKWEDGKWTTFERVPMLPPGESFIKIDRGFHYIGIKPHSTSVLTDDLSRFYPLEEGAYRIRLGINVSETHESHELPTGVYEGYGDLCHADIYFTILPAPEE